MPAYSIDSLEVADNPIVLFRGIVGSRAYGTQNANSDMDVRGIFVVPSAEYARLAQPPKQVADERNDRTYYSLVRFCELMSEANPTTIEMLFLPDDCIMKTSPAHSMLVDNRGLFVTQKAVDSHLGYALSQIKKARGTNKRVWNPWPEEPPQAEDYCLFLGDAKGRAALCQRYAMAVEKMPPTPFVDVLAETKLEPDELDAIREVLAQKEHALESDTVTSDARIADLLSDRYDSLAVHLWRKRGMTGDVYGKLEQCFRDIVKGEKQCE